MSWESLLAQARTLSERQGIGAVLLRLGTEVELIPLPGCRDVCGLDLSAPDFTAMFDARHFPRLFAAEELLLGAAQRMTARGVALRQQGRLDLAYYCYRFALMSAVAGSQLPGVKAICGNLWQLPQSLRDLRRGQNDFGQETGARPTRETLQALEELAQQMGTDCALLAPRVLSLAESLESGGAPGDALAALHAARRLFDVADDPARSRELLHEMQSRSGAPGESGLLHEAVFEELAQSRIGEVTLALFQPEAEDAKGFLRLWETYQQERPGLAACEPAPDGERACCAALKAFEQLRGQAVAAGGAFGHRISYGVSGLLQPIGRDWTSFLLAKGNERAACEAAERLRCRALCDWMARTHANNRLLIRPDLEGSAGEVRPAGLREMALAAAQAQAPLLMYFTTPRGYTAWLQKTGGELVTCPLEHTDTPLAEMRSLMPKLGSLDRTGRGGGLTRHFVTEGEPPCAERFSACLRALRAWLLPPRLEQALRDEPPRIIIVPDGPLNDVPFCALPDASGSFLVESRDLLYWPSVTAGLILEPPGWRRVQPGALVETKEPPSLACDHKPPPDSAVPAAKRALAGVVLGDPDYREGINEREDGTEVCLHFPPLPGTRREAESIAALLGVEPRLGEAASAAGLMGPGGRSARGMAASVLHVAAHGCLDPVHPERSFLALSGGRITVGRLRDFDPGLRVGLVMLSACQTGTGHEHPDSLVSLANAFHIAGACSVGATLWKIDDAATVQLMTRFYQDLLGTEALGLAEALRRSQLAMLRTERNPYFWGAFKISGSNANPLNLTG